MGRPPIRTEPVRTAEPRSGRTRVRKGGSLRGSLDIPDDVKAAVFAQGSDLQWVAVEVLGRPEPQMRMSFEINGWQPVIPDTTFDGLFDGMFMPKGYKGEINVGGQVLMERPIELTMEARAEDEKAAKLAVQVQTQNLRRGQVDGVTLDTQTQNARGNTFVNREMLAGIPIPR